MRFSKGCVSVVGRAGRFLVVAIGLYIDGCLSLQNLGPSYYIRDRIRTTRQLRAAPDDDHHGIPLAPQSPIEASATFVGAETTVDPSPAIAISSPLRGSGWLVGNGCCDELNPHRGAVIAINGAHYAPERFAMDVVQLDQD